MQFQLHKLALISSVSFSIVLGSVTYTIGQVQPSRIALAQSDTQVEQLIRSIDTDYANFTVNSALKFVNKRVEKRYRRAKIKAWEKADLDNNGYLDLLVTGTQFNKSKVVCLLDMGNGKVVLDPFDRQFYRPCPIAKLIYEGTQPLISYTDFDKPFADEKPQGKQSLRLIYKYGGFIEYHPRANSAAVMDSVVYESSFAYHKISEERLTIDSAGKATYYSCTYSVLDEAKKTYESLKTIIDNQSLSEITGLIAYLAGQHLQPSYWVNANHIPHTTTTITYRNGSRINVEDKGEIGTFGLMRLYALLGQLHKSQSWQPTKP